MRDPVVYRRDTERGLRVVALPQPQLHRAHVALYVRVGSRFETRANNGLSHFLEHMLYRGTERLPSAHDVNYAFERLGGTLYAATHTDFGVFSLTLPKTSVDLAVPLFADVLTAPTFGDIEIEKGIVGEEILEDLDDEGRQIDADNLSRMLIYPTHPLGFTITGDAETVNGFDVARLSEHHRRHYTASTSVLVFSGNIEPERCFDLAARSFEGMPRGDVILAEPPVHTQKRARVRVIENQSSQTELRVCMRGPGESAEERPIVDMLMRVVDDGMSTRLYHRICDAQGLCYDVGASFDGYEDDGVIDFAAGVQHARTSTVTGEILSLMKELGGDGPTEEELDKARQRQEWELESMMDSAEDLAGFYGGGLLFGRSTTPEKRLQESAAVTSEQVREMARILSQPDRVNVLAVGLLDPPETRRLSEVVKRWEGG